MSRRENWLAEALMVGDDDGAVISYKQLTLIILLYLLKNEQLKNAIANQNVAFFFKYYVERREGTKSTNWTLYSYSRWGFVIFFFFSILIMFLFTCAGARFICIQTFEKWFNSCGAVYCLFSGQRNNIDEVYTFICAKINQ